MTLPLLPGVLLCPHLSGRVTSLTGNDGVAAGQAVTICNRLRAWPQLRQASPSRSPITHFYMALGASPMPSVTLDASDAGELAGMLSFPGEWLTRDPRLEASPAG